MVEYTAKLIAYGEANIAFSALPDPFSRFVFHVMNKNMFNPIESICEK